MSLHTKISAPQADLLVLGASNLRLALRSLWRLVEGGREREPVHLVAVCGHGRAYAAPSLLGGRLLGRGLPPIAEAVRRLEARGGLPADGHGAACLADLGNDLAYGIDAGELLAAVDDVLARLDGFERLVLVEPPVESVAGLGPTWFRLLASTLFPGRTLDQTALVDGLERLREGVRRRVAEDPGRRRGIAVPDPWWTVDGIHVRWRRRVHWCRLLLDAAGVPAPVTPAPLRAGAQSGLPFWLPAEETELHVLGRILRRSRPQPVHQRPGGATLSLA